MTCFTKIVVPMVCFICSPSQEGDSQTIIATARGVFTSAGGILESRETGQHLF